MRSRGFEKISFEQFKKDIKDIEDVKKSYEKLVLPKRLTKGSAGYDICSVYSFILKPGEIIRIPTGLKAYFKEDEYLSINVRGSIGFKHNIRLCNQTVIVDADYYNNPKNDGHIWLAVQNHGDSDWQVNQGDRICQGIFSNYLVIDNESNIFKERSGGFGSTGKQE